MSVPATQPLTGVDPTRPGKLGNTGPFRFDLLEQVLKLHLGVAQRDNGRMFEILAEGCPLTVYTYPSGADVNGWEVPQHWTIERALVKRDGEVLFDGTEHILGVCNMSVSFSGKLSKAELDKHVFYSKAAPHAYLYNPMSGLRPWERRWALSIPWERYKDFPEGEYEIDLVTRFEDHGTEVAELRHDGESAETIVFNAHTCHPCQANDGLSGGLVMMELFNWLRPRKTRYSYRGLLGAEHMGSVHYVASLSETEIANIKLGIFLESVGSETPLALQQSFTGTSIIDRIAEYVLRDIEPGLKVGKFRTIVGNDETVWEAPGIEVPMVSITRHPYPQYHTSDDNLENQSTARLQEVLDGCKRMINILEEDRTIHRKFCGLVALSNPRFDLYRRRANPTIDYGLSEENLRWGLLQDYVMRYFDGRHSAFEIARANRLPFEEVRAYLAAFAEKGLVELKPLASIEAFDTLEALTEVGT